MADQYYRVKYSPQSVAIIDGPMTHAQWSSKYGNSAVLAFKVHRQDVWYDVSEWVLELQITHEEYDGEKSGRDPDKGKMKRYYITTKHKLQVKMLDRVPQSVVHMIYEFIDSKPNSDKALQKLNFKVQYQFPCATNGLDSQTMYCTTINFGAQRYDRNDNTCYYYGMNFNLIEW